MNANVYERASLLGNTKVGLFCRWRAGGKEEAGQCLSSCDGWPQSVLKRPAGLLAVFLSLPACRTVGRCWALFKHLTHLAAGARG